jgi:glycosyltransferase involved in cell wall biosynthesis
MASAVPVVTTTTGGIPELVRQGQNGLLTAPRDIPAVTTALYRLLRDPALRDRLGRAGRRTVEEEYDVDTAARVLQGVFGLRDLTVAGAGAT